MSHGFQAEVDDRMLTEGQVRVDAARVAGWVAPRPMGMAFLAVALLSTLPWVAFVLWAVRSSASDHSAIAGAQGTTWFLAGPIVVLLALPALGTAGSHGARALFAALLTGVAAAAGGTLATYSFLEGRSDDVVAAVVFAGLYASPAALVALVSAALATRDARRDLQRERTRRVLALLHHFGSLDGSRLKDAVGGGGDRALDDAAAQEPLERAHGRVWTASRFRARKALLLARLEGGERELASLVEAVREPEEVVRAWLDAFRSDGLLEVRIEGGRVEVVGEAEQAPCGGCGGSMRLVGRGLWRCLHCGNERSG